MGCLIHRAAQTNSTSQISSHFLPASSAGKRLVAIDGKTFRRSHDAGNDLGALHLVSARASEEGIALEQVATATKSNEITAIPVLLDQLYLSDTIVTIDASEVRYCICSRYLSGKRFAEEVRGHWAIESMHWVLDVTFREDESRTRERIMGNNLGWLRRFAVTLLKRHPVKDSIRGKMLQCSYSTDFLTEVLTHNNV